MLVLSRRPEESIAIGANITLVVLGIKGNQVRLGFRAPRDVVIDRTEVQHRKRVEYRHAHRHRPAQTTS